MSSSPAVSGRTCSSGARLSGFRQFVQRNRRIQGERPGVGAPQHGDVADRSKAWAMSRARLRI